MDGKNTEIDFAEMWYKSTGFKWLRIGTYKLWWSIFGFAKSRNYIYYFNNYEYERLEDHVKFDKLVCQLFSLISTSSILKTLDDSFYYFV